jgi:hypothetical protein
VARVVDDGGIPVTVGQVLDVFGGSVVLIPESTLGALTIEARGAFARAAERTTGAVVFVVPDVVFTADF